jgi:signal transduction histidine kinase
MKKKMMMDTVKKHRKTISLKLKLTLSVILVLALCVLLSLGIDALLRYVLFQNREIPVIVDLLLISILVGVLVTAILSTMFFEPIKKLSEAVNQVSNGDFTVNVETRSSAKEMKELYKGFNLMTRELRATEILQTNFVSNVSHEFKTPINAIEGYAMLLQDCENLNDEQKVYVEKIVFNTSRLSVLAGNILLLSKIENQSISTNKVSYSLDEQIRQAILELEPLWEPKEIEFDVDMQSIVYYGNEQLMRHVWTNLISNAVKFSSIGGIIRISLSYVDSQIEFYIEDNGPGVAEDAQKHIFDKFYQGDTSHKSEGNGLGLSLVKQILKIEDGSISVKNGEISGCRFTVMLKK